MQINPVETSTFRSLSENRTERKNGHYAPKENKSLFPAVTFDTFQMLK
jgi:hypothetical protein